MTANKQQVYTSAVLVGDMHIQEVDIPEARKFIAWIIDGVKALTTAKTKVILCFMGDQYPDFGVAKVEVQAFWKQAYDDIQNAGIESLSLVGNHDENQKHTATFMTVHDKQTMVIGKDIKMIAPDIGAVGFIRNETVFYAKVMEAYALGMRRLLCHVEFNGCQYENGFYAPHGFDLSKYPSDLKFISGHIHLKQEFGKVFYVGTPRCLTRSDIGDIKGIHVFRFDADTYDFIVTPLEICTPFQSIVINEQSFDTASLSQIPNSSKIYIEIQGTKEFSRKISNLLPEAAHIRSTYTEELKEVKIRESEGVPKSFDRFAKEFWVNNPVSLDIQKEIIDRIYRECPSLKLGLT